MTKKSELYEQAKKLVEAGTHSIKEASDEVGINPNTFYNHRNKETSSKKTAKKVSKKAAKKTAKRKPKIQFQEIVPEDFGAFNKRKTLLIITDDSEAIANIVQTFRG